MKRLLRKATNYQVLVLAVVAVAAAVVLFFVEFHTRGVLSHAIGGIAGTVLSIGLVLLAYELRLRRSLVTEFLVAVNLKADLAAAGILEIRNWGSILDWKAFFDDHSGDIDIVVSYARTWSANNADRVIQTAAQSGSRVTVTVLNPDATGSLLAFYAETYETTVDVLRNRIREVVGIWRDAVNRAPQPPSVRVEGIDRHMPYSFYRSGDFMWVVFSARRAGRGADDIPAILCQKAAHQESGLFDWVTKDLEACRRSNHTDVLWETS